MSENKVLVNTTATSGLTVELIDLPDKCPFCHNSIIPRVLFSSVSGGHLDVFLKCPNKNCNACFIGYFHTRSHTGSSYHFTGGTSPGRPEDKEFNETIETISPDFVNIYNQAYQAEQHELLEICGVGYRKALEFLIKDYLILNLPIDRDMIEKKPLYKCITENVVDASIKKVASRAVWLGNDETHYVRIWEGKNLKDLKKLIDLTVHWIEAEVITKSFEEEMPG